MLLVAARALTRQKNENLSDRAPEIVSEFKTHFVDTKLFWDTYAHGKFAQYFFRVHEEHASAESPEAVHQLIEEATLFVDAAHQCYARLGASLGAPTAGLGISLSPATTTGPGA